MTTLPPQPPLPKDVADTSTLGVYTPDHGIVAAQGGTVSTDTYNVPSAPLIVSATVTATNPSVGTDSTAIPGSETLIGAKDGSGNLKAAQTDGTNLLVKETSSAAILAKLVVSPALESGNLASILTQVTNHTETNSAAIKTDLDAINTATAASKADLDTIVTNTNKIPASPAQEGGNLATLAGIVSSSKAATKAATNDIVDLATLLALAGTSGDANTVASFMGRLTKIRDLLSGSIDSVTSNVSVETWIMQQILAGKGFAYAVAGGAKTSGGAVNSVCLSVFNPSASGKNILIYQIAAIETTASAVPGLVTTYSTTDLALTAGTITNLATGNATTSVASCTYATTAQTPGGNIVACWCNSNNSSSHQLFASGEGILLPKDNSVGRGIAAYINLAGAETWNIVMRGIEF